MLKDISPKMNDISEGIALLKHLGAGEKYADLKESLSKRYALSFQDGLRKFELLERIEQKAEIAFQDKMNEIRYYFSVCSNNKFHNNAEVSCAGVLALLWEVDMELRIESIPEIRRYLAEVSEEEYCGRFGELLQNYTDIIHLENDKQKSMTKEPFAVIQYLMKMDISDEEKWKLQKIFCDRDEHQQIILSLLDRAIEIIHDFYAELNEMTELFVKYWSSSLKEHSIIDFLSENGSLEIPENPLGFYIRPSVICPNVIFMQMNMSEADSSRNKPDYFKFGILFGDDFPIRNTHAQNKKDDSYETYVSQALKLLSDKSKFEILSYIRDKSAYGSELAKHLNLTTATVSHHMNTLLSSGLVRLKRVDNRVYYISNKEALEEILHYCGQILTGKD